MTLPIVAIIGRPNVGKSTLFNRIAKKRIAIVDKTPGVTRDRNYMSVNFNNKQFVLVDTGGFEAVIENQIQSQMREQAKLAIEEADSIVFLADGQAGITHLDREIFEMLRHSGKPVYLSVNKIDGPTHHDLLYVYYELGPDRVFALSAEHGIGVETLLEEVTSAFATVTEDTTSEEFDRIAVVGKPNSGKSTLINRLLGEERLIVNEVAGTTRDSIDTIIENGGIKYQFIDTAGIRKKGRVSMKLEKYSIIMALKSVERSDICILMIDATTGLTEQDVIIGGYMSEAGRGCLIVINKWDILKSKGGHIEDSKKMVREKMKFLSYAPILFLSAKTGLRAKDLFPAINDVASNYHRKIPTTLFNKVIASALKRRPPPSYRGRQIKVYYGTQVKNGPPTFMLFVNFRQGLTTNYIRYLHNFMRNEFDLDGTPIRFVIKESHKENRK